MLNIFRASAGSGKTYRLTESYLTLLLANDSKKRPHRSILAVTFTNKATDEMKSRILLELDSLASGHPSGHLNKLTTLLSLPEDKVREKAKQVLVEILHDYSHFSVSTIDRFFQQVIRSFTREIGLQGGYNVELDKDKILVEAIERMMYDLDKSEHKQLLLWLTQFSEEKIEQGGNWNIRFDIQRLANEIFKEKYATFSDEVYEKLQDKDFIRQYKAELFEIKKEFEGTMIALSEKALDIITRKGLKTNDFKGGSRSVFNKLHKIKTGDIEELSDTFIALPNNLDNWFTKTAAKSVVASIENAYVQGLNDCLLELVDFHQANILQYLSIKYITQNIYTLGILSDIDKQVKNYLEEKNLMLLSDSNSLLNKIIDGSDTPFIYEKTGIHIDHYMIDEFQDTSAMQWANFYPLIKNSLAQNYKNLIVGDVKQSIYRWRNSDWKLLSEQLERDFLGDEIAHEVLDVNWRSKKNIVDFNNAFFSIASSILQTELNNDIPSQVADVGNLKNKISNAYKKLYQKQSPGNETGGHVCVEFVEMDKNDEKTWKEKVLEKIPFVLEQLQDNKFSLKDIAILVRTKDEGKMVADCLLEYKKQHPEKPYQYDIISDEALLIANSDAVKFIICLLRYFINPQDHINNSIVAYEYLTNSKQLSPTEAFDFYFSHNNTSLSSIFDDDTKEGLEHAKHLSLFEMVEEIIHLFHLGETSSNSIFLQAFQDVIFDFVSNNNADIDNFIKWWDNTGNIKSISMPSGQDAVRIMTIHKSKGLDFEAVLIPFCDWTLDQKQGNILWCEPHIAPYNQLSIIPIPYNSKLKNTIFYDDYINEKMHSYIDNLNVAYVAFTRSRRELIAFAPSPSLSSSVNPSKSIGGLMFYCFENANSFPLITEDDNEIINLNQAWDSENLQFQLGADETVLPKKLEFKKEELKLNVYTAEESNKRLRLRLHSIDYFSEKEKKINYGSIMHELLKMIQTSSDIDNAILEMVQIGKINQEESIIIKQKIIDFIALPSISNWFSEKYKILNEMDIISPKNHIHRPDRILINGQQAIIIDYKFGEKEEQKHHKQIRNYMTLVSEMGYTTKGFLCYVELGKVEEVNLALI